MIWDIIAGRKPRTPEDAFCHAITTWEGLYQAYPEDVGNWVTLPNGERRLVGTMRGVTPAAYAAYLKVQPWTLTADDMKALPLETAVEIGMKGYYQDPRWNRLPFSPAVEVWVDIGWGSGPFSAVGWMQEMIGVFPDRAIGPMTERAWSEWMARGDEDAVREIHHWRVIFYRRICEKRPANAKFLQGWLNRANHYLPGTAWWKEWTWQ